MRPQILYLNRIKAISCIAVVILHTFFAADGFAQTVSQHTVLLGIRNLMTWSVPCFVMCSGVLLLDAKKEIGLNKIVKAYIPRMIRALVVFSLLFAAFDSFFLTKKTVPQTVVEGIKNVLTGNGWKHMWYIYMMIALYLMLPVYRLISKAASDKELKYLLFLYGVFLSLAPLIEKIVETELPFYIFVFSIYPLYLFAGYFLHQYPSIGKLAALLMSVIFIAATLILTYISCSNNDQTISELLSNYSSPLIIIGSLGFFVLMRYTTNKRIVFIDAASELISKCSFGVYLIHMAFLKYVFAVKQFNPMAKGGCLTVFGLSLLVFLMSLAVTYVTLFVKKKIVRK